MKKSVKNSDSLGRLTVKRKGASIRGDADTLVLCALVACLALALLSQWRLHSLRSGVMYGPMKQRLVKPL